MNGLSGSANDALTTQNAEISSSVIFSFDSLPAGFNPATGITNVTFQYGTALSEGHVTCTTNCTPLQQNLPEPGTVALAGIAMLGWMLSRRRPNS